MMRAGLFAVSMRREPLPYSTNAEHLMAMPVGPERQRRWTLREVHALRAGDAGGTRYELVGGTLLVTPSPTGLHQNAVLLLCAALYPYVRRERVGHAAIAPRDVGLEDESSVQPDVLVVPLDEMQRYRGSKPVERLLLAAEVLSRGSVRGDRVDKRTLYQRNNVSEYWIVDVEARLIERWRPRELRPEIVVDRIEWLPAGAAEPFILELPQYFAEVRGE
jgi:Uma2 family endonuclease